MLNYKMKNGPRLLTLTLTLVPSGFGLAPRFPQTTNLPWPAPYALFPASPVTWASLIFTSLLCQTSFSKWNKKTTEFFLSFFFYRPCAVKTMQKSAFEAVAWCTHKVGKYYRSWGLLATASGLLTCIPAKCRQRPTKDSLTVSLFHCNCFYFPSLSPTLTLTLLSLALPLLLSLSFLLPSVCSLSKNVLLIKWAAYSPGHNSRIGCGGLQAPV